MPTYKYRCEECGQIIKISCKMNEEKTPDKCNKCGSTKLSRIFSPVGIFVKGGSLTEGSTCCGRDTPCDIPPCADGTCQRFN